jgi:hypothetical protein
MQNSYRAFGCRQNIHKDRDIRNPAKIMRDFQINFSCEMKGGRIRMKVYLKTIDLPSKK